MPQVLPRKNIPQALPAVREITFDHPWRWLAAGWSDLRANPGLSLGYGAIFVVVSYLITYALVTGEMFFLVPALAAGFFLVAPLLGIGLYAASRSHELGVPAHFGQLAEAWRGNHIHLTAMGLALMIMLLVWMMLANLIFALFFKGIVPTWENFIPEVFLSGNSPLFLLAGIGGGAVIAFFVFAMSAVSVPMLMDRRVDVMTAIQTSLHAVRVNLLPMLLWAVLIVLFVGAGLATFYLGLLVTMPLVGHATWHAYRDLVAPER